MQMQLKFHQSIDLIRKSHTPYVVSGNMFNNKKKKNKSSLTETKDESNILLTPRLTE